MTIWIGMGALMAIVAFLGAKTDYLFTTQTIREVTPIISSITNTSSFIHAVIQLQELGILLGKIAQKYIVLGFMGLIYMVLEQRTNIKQTLRPVSVDRMKIGVWILFIITLGFSLFYLPYIYSNLHIQISRTSTLDTVLAGINKSNVAELREYLEIRDYLNDHNTSWFLIKIFTGYGNIISLLILGILWVLRKTIFENIPAKEIIRIIFPTFVSKNIDAVFDELDLE
jgi:hypothetical protein